MSNSRVVVITFGIRTSELPCLLCDVFITPRDYREGLIRREMLDRAQQECDYYGKDAVLNREEHAYSYTRYHYRCETRKADQDVQ